MFIFISSYDFVAQRRENEKINFFLSYQKIILSLNSYEFNKKKFNKILLKLIKCYIVYTIFIKNIVWH